MIESLPKLQVFCETLTKWYFHPKFGTNIVGFFARVDFGAPVGYCVGRIEGFYSYFLFDFIFLFTLVFEEVRVGRAYQLGEFECTKHLLISTPTQPNKTFRISHLSNEKFKEVNYIILFVFMFKKNTNLYLDSSKLINGAKLHKQHIYLFPRSQFKLSQHNLKHSILLIISNIII